MSTLAAHRRCVARIQHAARALLAAVALIVGCASGTAPRRINLPAPVESAAVGPGDIIEINVYEEAALSKPYRVAPNGSIDFPLIGQVAVEGKEQQEIAEAIRAKLVEAKIFKAPSVSVLVREVNSKKVTMLGQLGKPGQIPMTPGMTIVQAISVAGGFTALADKEHVTITRRVSKTKVVRVVFSVIAITDGRTDDVQLQAGDTVYVEERVF
jgi:protein involved in polysaccharide export with SLBB domain